MRSPRTIRPHKVKLFNLYPDEVDGKAVYKSTTFNNVKVQGRILNNISQSKGNDMQIVDDLVVIIDLSDAPSGYSFHEKWDVIKEGWTIHPSGDYFEYEDRELAVIGVTEINPFNKMPLFLEVKCKRK